MSIARPSLQTDLHTLYTDHQRWLTGWLRKRLGNETDAADLAHDIWLRILGKPQDLA